VKSAHGEGIFRVRLSEGQQRGSLFVPIHWTAETASTARACDLVAPHTDPYSGQPEAKATPASIAPIEYAYRGFALTRTPFEPPEGTWWARVALSGGIGTLLATNDEPKRWREDVERLMGGERAEFIDLKRGIYRAAAFRDGRLESALFLGPAETAPGWDAAKAVLELAQLGPTERRLVLSGRTADGLVETGPGDLRLFRRGPRRYPRGHRVEGRNGRRGDRQGVARGNELRLVPARIEKDRT